MSPLAQLTVVGRELDDLQLLLVGALAPMVGFGPPESGVTLTAPPAVTDRIGPGAMVRLLDVEGAPLADLLVSGTYPADSVGDGDGDGVGLVGTVHGVADREPRPFERLYRLPDDVRAAGGDWLVVPTDGPLTLPDVDRIASAAAGRRVLLLALVGVGRPRQISATGLIRATLAAADLLPLAEVVAVPLARRDDEGVDRCIRDRVVAAYIPGTGPGAGGGTGPAGPVLNPTGEGRLPDSVAAAVYLERPVGTSRGAVVLLTGLSGSGKSTIARGLRNALVEAGERTVTMLDGDVVRRHLSAGLGFTRQDRDTNIRRIGWVAAEIARHGGVAIASPIAPFAATRAAVRDMVDAAGGVFLLVHVATPLAECERRDRKGLYARARAGEIAEFTGISSPYEQPTEPDVRIDTTACDVSDAVAAVLAELRARGLIER